MGSLLHALLAIPAEEVRFSRRGFHRGDPEAQEHLEGVGRAFLEGYSAALRDPEPSPLARRLGRLEPELAGFAYEGAGMALALGDFLAPWRPSRLPPFLDGPGHPHRYLVHVGAGWALGRTPMRIDSLRGRLDPFLGWLAVDGYGFHQGFFRWPEAVRSRRVPRKVRGYARRVFDQGLGRSLWFVEGADPERIVATVGTFPEGRRPDLWSGIGLACTYAGGVERSRVVQLSRLAGERRGRLIQGAAFAAEARCAAGNLTASTERVCRLLTGCGAEAVAERSRLAGQDLPPDSPEEPGFEVWRRRIEDAFEESDGKGGASCADQADFSVATA